MEGLLKREELLEEDLVTLDLAVHEVASALWKHQYLLGDLSDGLPYLSILYGLVESSRIRLVPPSEELTRRSYVLAARNKISVYDAIFISLALSTGLKLKTFDEQQLRIVQDEARK